MARRKHTRCAVCSRVGRYRYFEVQWRWTDQQIWHWSGGWMCAGCGAALRSGIDQLRPSLLAFDG